MLNKVQIIGRMGKDPETKNLSNGQTVANFTVATSEKWTDKNGEKQEKTEWHRVVAYGKLAEIVKNLFSKGGLVYVEGKLQTRQWEDKDGKKNYSTEIWAATVLTLSSVARPKSEEKTSEFSPEPGSFVDDEEYPF